MNTVQAGFAEHGVIVRGDFCQRIRASIGRNALDFRKPQPDMPQNFRQPIRPQYHCIGILQKNCLSVAFCQPAEHHLVAEFFFVKRQCAVFRVNGFHVICPAFKMAQQAVAVIRHAVNVLFYLCNRTGVEVVFLIQHTKFAFIPGAVFRHAQKQAVGFAGRADWPYFECIYFIRFHKNLLYFLIRRSKKKFSPHLCG